jgi:hypothetical protein
MTAGRVAILLLEEDPVAVWHLEVSDFSEWRIDGERLQMIIELCPVISKTPGTEATCGCFFSITHD